MSTVKTLAAACLSTGLIAHPIKYVTCGIPGSWETKYREFPSITDAAAYAQQYCDIAAFANSPEAGVDATCV